VRLSDGQVTSFAPNIPSGTVTSVAAVGDRVYIGGLFTSAGGKTRNNVASYVLPAGTVTDWAPNPVGRVETIVATANRVYLGGQFTSVLGDATRDFLVAVTPDNLAKVVTTFSPKPNGIVRRIHLAGGNLYAGGDFTQIGNEARSRVAILNADTGVESTLLDASIPTTGANRVLTVLPIGPAVYFGGTFTSAGGNNRARAAAIQPIIGSATGWDPGANSDVNLLLFNSGRIVACGEFTRLGLRGANPNVNGPTTYSHTYLAVFDTAPVITQFRINAGGNPEITFRDGVGIGNSGIEVQSQDALGGPWQGLTVEDMTGSHVPFVDNRGNTQAQRFYRLFVP
jgi:hypothetical protein